MFWMIFWLFTIYYFFATPFIAGSAAKPMAFLIAPPIFSLIVSTIIYFFTGEKLNISAEKGEKWRIPVSFIVSVMFFLYFKTIASLFLAPIVIFIVVSNLKLENINFRK